MFNYNTNNNNNNNNNNNDNNNSNNHRRRHYIYGGCGTTPILSRILSYCVILDVKEW